MAEFTITPAWRRDAETIERQAIQFWKSLSILPPGVDPAARAKELIAIAHHGNEFAGVATATLDELPFLRARFAMFRCAVAPQFRGSRLASELTIYAKPLLEQWSREHAEERVQGMAVVLEANLGDKSKKPVWPASGLTLVGYSAQGLQVRVAWFEHARVD